MSRKSQTTRYVLVAAALLGCEKGEEVAQPNEVPPAQGEHHDEAGHEELPSRVHLPEEVLAKANIRSARVTVEALPATVDLTGELAMDPDASAEVPARAPGRVVDVRFKEGQRVRAGDLLLVIESPELARARAAVTATRAKADVARKNAARVLSLAAKGLTSGQEAAAAEAEAHALEADAQAAEQNLSAFGVAVGERTEVASRLELRSPMSGVVLSRNAVRGQSVDTGTVMAIVANLSRAYFLGRLFEKDLARVVTSSAVEVRLNAYPNVAFTGVVEVIGRQIDPSARTVVARIALSDDQDRLKIGLFGTARVSTSEAGQATAHLVVPASAVTRIGDADIVFVRHPDADFEVHKVTLGRSAEGKVEVLSGLREDEEVVVDGVFTLKSIVLKGTFGEEE